MTEYQSANIEKLAEALCKAQAIMEGARKENSNPFHKSKYADLESIWSACRGPLTENGLSIVQTVDYKEEKITLITSLIHASGQWMRSFYPIIPVKQLKKDEGGHFISSVDPQSIGSAITYARRYSLAAMVGLYQVDDDAEEAMRPYREQEEKNPREISDKQRNFLTSLSQNDLEGTQRICAQLKVKSIWEVPADQVAGVINWFNVRKKEKENGSARVA